MSARVGVPLEGGHSEALLRERASATPAKQTSRATLAASRPKGARAPRGAPPIEFPLRSLQRWFAAAIMHPSGIAASIVESATEGGLAVSLGEVDRVLLPSSQLEGIERLAIYRDAYQARLVECLADDYPALEHALGSEAFEAMCLRYIARHPSESPNLNAFGRQMASFCRTEENPPLPFSADLAALEWALVEVLHAPSAEKLELAKLASIPVSEWAGARFAPSSTVRVMEFAYPVNAYFQAFRTEEGPTVPDSAWSATAVFRDGPTIWRMDLGRAMHALLTALFGGTPLEPALEALAETGQLTDEESTQVMVWFRDWVGHGFFAAIETD